VSGYVVDASVAIKWFIPEIHSEAAVQARRLRQRLHVPAFFTLELGNVIAKKIRREELTRAEGKTMLKELQYLPLQRHADERLFPAAYELVRIPLNPAADSERIRPPLGAPRRRASVVCPQWPTSV